MAKTQKNKATSYHLGQLKAKLAKLKRELLTPTSSGGGGGCKYHLLRDWYSRSDDMQRALMLQGLGWPVWASLAFLPWERVRL